MDIMKTNEQKGKRNSNLFIQICGLLTVFLSVFNKEFCIKHHKIMGVVLCQTKRNQSLLAKSISLF